MPPSYLFLMNTIKGMQSLNLCGPGLAFGAYAPLSLSSSQCDGADSRF